jgi:hypothetical protein
MEAFSIHVHHTGKLNFHNWAYFDKNELSVSASGRLVHRGNGVLLESRELAEQYKDAITARRIKSGDREFDAEVECVSGSYPEFSESIKKDSEVIRQKLEAWNYPTPQNQNIVFNDKGWVIRIQHEDKKQLFYLMSLGKKSLDFCGNKDKAKIYKQESFVQKALEQINKVPKLRAVATEVE